MKHWPSFEPFEEAAFGVPVDPKATTYGSVDVPDADLVILGLVPRICRGLVWAVRAWMLTPVGGP
jgi:hypothetical protein